MTLFILQIAPREIVRAWRTKDANSFIDVATDLYGMVYEKWCLEKASEAFGLKQIPCNLLELLEEEGEVVDVNWGAGDNSNIFRVRDAPSKLDVAKQAVFHGTVEGYVFSRREAEAFVEGQIVLKAGGKDLFELAIHALRVELSIDEKSAKL